MAKQKARIEEWRLMGGCLWGYVKGHSEQDSFTPNRLQVTSQIISLNEDTGIAETENTIYTLGTKLKEQDYA